MNNIIFAITVLYFFINNIIAAPTSKSSSNNNSMASDFDIFLSFYSIPNDAAKNINTKDSKVYLTKLSEKSVHLHDFGDTLVATKSKHLQTVWNELKHLSTKTQTSVKDFILQTTKLYNSLSGIDREELDKIFLRLYGYKFSNYFVYSNYNANSADEFLTDSIDRMMMNSLG